MSSEERYIADWQPRTEVLGEKPRHKLHTEYHEIEPGPSRWDTGDQPPELRTSSSWISLHTEARSLAASSSATGGLIMDTEKPQFKLRTLVPAISSPRSRRVCVKCSYVPSELIFLSIHTRGMRADWRGRPDESGWRIDRPTSVTCPQTPSAILYQVT
jgi:hypothetical protein